MNIVKKLVTVNGLNMAYYCSGTGPPLLFLHGGRLRALTFKPLLKLLARRYMVIAPDLPGYGASATPRAVWSYTDYAMFLEAFLTDLQLQNVVLVGYSMGGGIAGNLAANSRRIKQLVLIDTAGVSAGTGRKRGGHAGYIPSYLVHPSRWMAFWSLGHDSVGYLWKHRYDHMHMRAVRQACARTSYEYAWPRITVPTLLLWGRDDQIIPLKVGLSLQKLIPHATLETVAGNHDWLLYNAGLIARFML
jgi:pimeloyl-ACP methyl ester carboxylesterase